MLSYLHFPQLVHIWQKRQSNFW